MRFVFPLTLACLLVGLASLPIGYAHPQAHYLAMAQYLPVVFKAANTPTVLPTNTRAPTVPPTATLISTTPPQPTNPADNPLYTNGRDEYNCTDFDTWADADAVFQANRDDGDPNRLDNDRDGIPCENLPGAPPSP